LANEKCELEVTIKDVAQSKISACLRLQNIIDHLRYDNRLLYARIEKLKRRQVRLEEHQSILPTPCAVVNKFSNYWFGSSDNQSGSNSNSNSSNNNNYGSSGTEYHQQPHRHRTGNSSKPNSNNSNSRDLNLNNRSRSSSNNLNVDSRGHRRGMSSVAGSETFLAI
jgi:hypothetical protein